MIVPPSIRKFVDVFSALPGIGPRQAVRLAFHFVYKGGGLIKEAIAALSEIEKVKICKQCFYIVASPQTNADHTRKNAEVNTMLCDICADKKRNQKVIAIVEKETDLISIENTGKYSGRYLILGDLRKRGMLEPDQKLKLENLKDFIKKDLGGKAEEIIIAINPTSVGGVNAEFITKELKPLAAKITRLGIGIPSGGEIEFADEDTLTGALERRS